MSKERYQVTVTPEGGNPKSIIINANEMTHFEVLRKIYRLKKENPESLMTIFTPDIPRYKITSIINAGAQGHRRLTPEEEKKLIHVSLFDRFRSFLKSNLP